MLHPSAKMIGTTTVLACLLAASVVFGAALPELDTELILVHAIFRHGERTTYRFYPNDPNKNETFYPIGLGGLTNRGKMSEYNLGRFLREQYDDFLGEDYTDGKVYVRSTNTPRTKMSAQLVLAGLMPPSTQQMWNPELLWQPIPIEYKDDKDEDIFPVSTCTYREQVLADLLNRPEVQNAYIKPNQKLFNYISDKSGMSIKDAKDLLEFYFILNIEDDFNMTLPEWTSEIYPEPLYSLASQVYEYHNLDPAVRKINSGYLLAKILKDTISKVQNILQPSDRKIFLYSGHETTLGYMMEALQVFKAHIPPYASALIFEVHKNNDGHFLKLKYRDSTSATRARELTIPGCETLCPIEKFILLHADLIPSVPYKEACEEIAVPEEIQKQELD